jgi:ADP-ribose pyrophosphatase YjhB (NUDIX family)
MWNTDLDRSDKWCDAAIGPDFQPGQKVRVMEKTLLDLSREIHAISSSGFYFSKDPYDLQRFKQLNEIAAELIAKHSVHSKQFVNKVFSAESGYVTPKIDVRGAIFADNKILMAKERASDAWTLPGGYVDVNESLSQAVEREVLEESGFSVKAKKVAAIYDHRKHGYKAHLYHFYKIYLLCDLVGGSENTDIETSEVAYLAKSDLDTMSLDPGRITKAHVLRMFDHYSQPSLPTDFD